LPGSMPSFSSSHAEQTEAPRAAAQVRKACAFAVEAMEGTRFAGRTYRRAIRRSIQRSRAPSPPPRRAQPSMSMREHTPRNISLTKQLTLRGGPGRRRCPRSVGQRNDFGRRPLASTGTLILSDAAAAGTVIDGFTFSGGTSLGVIQTQSGSDFSNVQVLNNRISGFTGDAVFLNRGGSDMTFSQNVFDGSSQTGSGERIPSGHQDV